MNADRPAAAPAQRRLSLSAALLAAGVCALLLTALPAQAQWKWRDANGRVQISDLAPPPSVPEKDILQRPRGAQSAPAVSAAPAAPAASAASAAPAAAAKPKGPLDAEIEKRRKAEEQDKAAKARAEEERRSAQRADNCNRAREMVTTLESGQRIARVNAKGEREFLDDGQRAAEVRRAREVMASDCR